MDVVVEVMVAPLAVGVIAAARSAERTCAAKLGAPPKCFAVKSTRASLCSASLTAAASSWIVRVPERLAAARAAREVSRRAVASARGAASGAEGNDALVGAVVGGTDAAGGTAAFAAAAGGVPAAVAVAAGKPLPGLGAFCARSSWSARVEIDCL